MRVVVPGLLLAFVAGSAVAQDWGKVATVSATMGVNPNQLCIGEASRGDIGCPAYAPYVSSSGYVGMGTSNLANVMLTISSSGVGDLQLERNTGGAANEANILFKTAGNGSSQIRAFRQSLPLHRLWRLKFPALSAPPALSVTTQVLQTLAPLALTASRPARRRCLPSAAPDTLV